VGFFVIISHSNLCIFSRYRMDRDHPVLVFSSFLHIHMTIHSPPIQNSGSCEYKHICSIIQDISIIRVIIISMKANVYICQ